MSYLYRVNFGRIYIKLLMFIFRVGLCEGLFFILFIYGTRINFKIKNKRDILKNRVYEVCGIMWERIFYILVSEINRIIRCMCLGCFWL